MSKYDPLGDYLRKQPAGHVPMSFGEIERVLGFALPSKAKGYRAWWSNSPTNNVMTKVWLDAGFKSEQVDMETQRIVFRRSEARVEPGDSTRAKAGQGGGGANGSARHGLFGCLKGTVRLAEGVDLTAPADPAWGQDR